MPAQSRVRLPVFVYGTLRRGLNNHHYLAGCPCLGRARTGPEYELWADSVPYCVRTGPDRGEAVTGELYEVDDVVLAALDELEGHPRVYRREAVDVEDANGARVRAWIYLFPGPRGRRVPGGDYLDHPGCR
jgi:gamma-glutamylcyclotransferase (GGCT)/AIG2-like uncharacterized protein YtfP